MAISIPFSLTPNRIKRAGAQACDLVGINRIGFEMQKVLFGPFIRAVNYHVIRAEDAKLFEAHLRYYNEKFCSVDLSALEGFLKDGKWPNSRPGLIISFDDGHSSHYEIAAPILEKYNFTGWFFVPIGLMKTPGVQTPDADALTEVQLKYLDRHHVVGSHSQTHCRLGDDVPLDRLKSEIIDSAADLEAVLGHPINTFCWVGGEEKSYGRNAAELIKQAYDYSFMTNTAIIRPSNNPLQLQRANIEAENPLWLVRFQLSGLMDILYSNKRKRVNRLTA